MRDQQVERELIGDVVFGGLVLSVALFENELAIHQIGKGLNSEGKAGEVGGNGALFGPEMRTELLKDHAKPLHFGFGLGSSDFFFTLKQVLLLLFFFLGDNGHLALRIAAFYLTCSILTCSSVLLLHMDVFQSADQEERDQENESTEQVVDVLHSNALLDLDSHSRAQNGRYLHDDGEICAKKAQTFRGYVVHRVWCLG